MASMTGNGSPVVAWLLRTRRVWPVLAVVALGSTACSRGEPGAPAASTRPDVRAVRQEPAESPVATERPLGVFYYQWSGKSPGGGFTRTSIVAFEIDLVRQRIRHLHTTAAAPEPMLPSQKDSIIELVAFRPWVPLARQEADMYLQLTTRWIETDPPASYVVQRRLGREDGWSEELTVSFQDSARSTGIVPRRGGSAQEGSAPPTAWTDLVAAALRSGRNG